MFELEKEKLLGPDVQLVHPMFTVAEEHAILASRGTSFSTSPIGEVMRPPDGGLTQVSPNARSIDRDWRTRHRNLARLFGIGGGALIVPVLYEMFGALGVHAARDSLAQDCLRLAVKVKRPAERGDSHVRYSTFAFI